MYVGPVSLNMHITGAGSPCQADPVAVYEQLEHCRTTDLLSLLTG